MISPISWGRDKAGSLLCNIAIAIVWETGSYAKAFDSHVEHNQSQKTLSLRK
uniref:Uncharacterized protein n=1 Tax=Anguilla anguilla TaxID=7936 RepID=A0A0E9P6P6_ANGAN